MCLLRTTKTHAIVILIHQLGPGRCLPGRVVIMCGDVKQQQEKHMLMIFRLSKPKSSWIDNVFHPAIFQHGRRKNKYNYYWVLTQPGRRGWCTSLAISTEGCRRFGAACGGVPGAPSRGRALQVHPACIQHAESAMNLPCSPLGGQVGEGEASAAASALVSPPLLTPLLCLPQLLRGVDAGCSTGKTPWSQHRKAAVGWHRHLPTALAHPAGSHLMGLVMVQGRMATLALVPETPSPCTTPTLRLGLRCSGLVWLVRYNHITHSYTIHHTHTYIHTVIPYTYIYSYIPQQLCPHKTVKTLLLYVKLKP